MCVHLMQRLNNDQKFSGPFVWTNVADVSFVMVDEFVNEFWAGRPVCPMGVDMHSRAAGFVARYEARI
jgi:hypothetical protein